MSDANLHRAPILERLFKATFYRDYQTLLRGGADEPLYQPVISNNAAQNNNAAQANIIYYRADYFASALHEVAHWCIAGPERRKQVDFGYWYSPDGRNEQQQAAFQAAEVKPQAIELLFSIAANYRFQPSLDNLSQTEQDMPAFKARVVEQAQQYLTHGLPARAILFYQQLAKHFSGPSVTELLANQLDISNLAIKERKIKNENT